MHENNGKPEALLWIDFETTGVDRRKSLPLEIGMECTDMLGEQKFGSLSRIIRPDRLDLLSMSPVAFSMHTDNGLLFELMGGSVRNDSMVVVANALPSISSKLAEFDERMRMAEDSGSLFDVNDDVTEVAEDVGASIV